MPVQDAYNKVRTISYDYFKIIFLILAIPESYVALG
jgi:hypothetical protein